MPEERAAGELTVTDHRAWPARSRSSPVPAPGSVGPRRSRSPRRARRSSSTTSSPTDVVDEIEALGAKALFVAGDVVERDTADALVAAATEHFGGLHIVVNNAGVTRDRMLFNMTDDEWDTVIGVHLRGHFLLVAQRRRLLARAGQGDRRSRCYGRIVNTSSEAGLTGSEGQPNYSAAKAGHHRAHARRRARPRAARRARPTRSARAPAPR